MNSPFKFLEPYGKNDFAFFYGRDKETAQLYNAVHASDLTLLYGGSGTGKTSLINCGLANKFYDTDWLPIFIRRRDNLNQSIKEALDKVLAESPETMNEDNSTLTIERKLNLLYLDYFKTIYLIFDQFEEIFILGTQAEQQLFYETVDKLLKTKGLHVKILISIREEWIAYLNDFEKVVPFLFDNRMRVEKMTADNLFQVVAGTLHHAGVEVEDLDDTVEAILDNIRVKKEGIELTNLQVYLDRVFRKASENLVGDKVIFTPSVVQQVGKMENVVSEFLDEELNKIETKMASRGVKNTKGLPLEILFSLVSDDGTKQALAAQDIIENLPPNRRLSPEDVLFCLNEFKNIRILKDVE